MRSQRSQSESSWHDESDEAPESKRREVEPELTPTKRKPKAKTPKGYVLGTDYYNDITGYHKYANIKSRPVHPEQPGLDPAFQWATEITRITAGRGGFNSGRRPMRQRSRHGYATPQEITLARTGTNRGVVPTTLIWVAESRGEKRITNRNTCSWRRSRGTNTSGPKQHSGHG